MSIGSGGGQTPAQRLAQLPPLGVATKRLEDGLSAFVDGLLEERFGLRRRHWQLLRWVHEHDETRLESWVAEAAMFYTADESRQVIDDLAARGWIDRRGDQPAEMVMMLSSAGGEGFAAMARAQETTWSVVLEGLSEQDYAATVRAITLIADNLDRALAAREARSWEAGR